MKCYIFKIHSLMLRGAVSNKVKITSRQFQLVHVFILLPLFLLSLSQQSAMYSRAHRKAFSFLY